MGNTFTKEQIYSDVDSFLSQVANLNSEAFEFIRNPEKLSTTTSFVRQIRPHVAKIRNYKSLPYPSLANNNFFYRNDLDGTYIFTERYDEDGFKRGFELWYESQGIFSVMYNGNNGRKESFSIMKTPFARIYTHLRQIDGRTTYMFQWQNVNGDLLEL